MADHTKPPGDPSVPQMQIDVDDAIAQGAYSNLVLINHNDNEFVLDFAYIQPAAPRARVRARIISSPRHAPTRRPRLPPRPDSHGPTTPTPALREGENGPWGTA